jgi:tetratricopeptide (TPR) repeat protein
MQIRLHPLVRDSFRQIALFGGRVDDYLETITALLARATTRADPRDPENWADWARLRGHADAGLVLLDTLARHHGTTALSTLRLPPGLLIPATRTGRFLLASGHPVQAVAAYESILAMGRPLLGDDHADVLSAKHDLYRVMTALGRQSEAEQGFRVVLDDRVRVLGPDHPDTLTTLHYLARTLRELGHHEEALQLLNRTLGRRVVVLGERHRDTLTTRNAIGDILAELGRYDEAEQTLRAVWAARIDILGAGHPATLVTLAHLTNLAYRIGAVDQASTHASELVALCQEVLGTDHPLTLEAIGICSRIEQSRGQLAESTHADLTSAHERSRRVLGPRHATTAQAGSTGEPIRLGERLVADRVRMLGEEHPDNVATAAALRKWRGDAEPRDDAAP